jgi:hypothetical protein
MWVLRYFFQAMLGKKVNTDRKNTDKIKISVFSPIRVYGNGKAIFSRAINQPGLHPKGCLYPVRVKIGVKKCTF